MKVGYTLTDRSEGDGGWASLPRNASGYIPPSTAEGAVLLMVAVIGGLGNVLIMLVTLACPSVRQMSSAFLFHHSLLDAIKSGFCLPFGYSLLLQADIPHCDVLGAGYILLMTVSAYNLLALLINEEYQCSFAARRSYLNNGDGCCIAFGVVIIWFTTILLHLGVAFLPGSSEFSHDVGNCVYRYGVTKNYVIHVLWVVLVTGAVGVASVSFVLFFRKLKSGAKSKKWTFLHKSLSSLSPHNSVFSDQSQEVHYEFDDISSQKAVLQTRRYLRRIVVMMAMVISFILCWYPFFFLILADVHYKQPAHVYRFLTILAWIHPVTTPIFCSVIYYDMAIGEKVAKDVYSTALPMTTSGSGDMLRQTGRTLYAASGSIGFHNENFFSTPNHISGSSSMAAGSSDESDESPEAAGIHCDTVINYRTDEGGCQTLIM